jgi:hypothetical protein
MRVEILSDHGSEQLHRTGRNLQAAGRDLQAWQRSHHIAVAELRSARRRKTWWRRVFGVFTTSERDALARAQATRQQVERAQEAIRHLGGRAQQQVAGAQGEESLTRAMSVLSGDWLDLRGYRNRKGETDHLFIGPTGVWAVEVKRQRVRINAVGDQWRYDKLDAWGNTVATGPAVDRGGRSWARQVTDVADDLGVWLARNGHHIRIHTAVMIMHHQAIVGRCERLTVDLLSTHPVHLLDALRTPATTLPSGTRADIERLVRRDHQHHEKRRRR